MKNVLFAALVLCVFLAGASLNLGGKSPSQGPVTFYKPIDPVSAQSNVWQIGLNDPVSQSGCQVFQDQLTQLQQTLQLALEMRKVMLDPSLEQSAQEDITGTIESLHQQIDQVQGKLSVCLNTSSSPTSQPSCQGLQDQLAQLQQLLQLALEMRKVMLDPSLEQSNAGAIDGTIQRLHQQIDPVQGKLSVCLTPRTSTVS